MNQIISSRGTPLSITPERFCNFHEFWISPGKMGMRTPAYKTQDNKPKSKATEKSVGSRFRCCITIVMERIIMVREQALVEFIPNKSPKLKPMKVARIIHPERWATVFNEAGPIDANPRRQYRCS
jgi:hypothetical protein